MRWSRAFIPTLRDDPADAEAASHKLLVRAGFIRQLMAGSYSLLPLGLRVAAKVERIIREEMDRIGGQEFLLPVVHPGEVWKKSGRWDDVEGILVKFQDRKGTDMLLAITHEEVFTLLAQEMMSYRDVPQLWYHLQTKFRDEPRPKAGLLRVREFTMKDSYSFDIDSGGLDVQFEWHRVAYTRIFDRFGLTTTPVEASSGAMGGSESVEFTVPSEAGEDDIAVCDKCGYAANVERATSRIAPYEDVPSDGDAPERVPTPGIRTIAELANAFEFSSAPRQIKTLAYVVDDELILIIVRGDHELMEQKLIDGLGSAHLRPAHPEEIQEALGALPGSIGAVGVEDLTVIADPALEGRTNMTTGANEDDWHLRGVDIARDIKVSRWIDVRKVQEGEVCSNCGEGALEVRRVIEVGHIFKLGTYYSEPLGATVLDEEGEERPLWMGSYGIGVGRAVAAIIEASHDESGIIWPMSVTPYEVALTVLRPESGTTLPPAETLYEDLRGAGIEVIIDDREERPGVKFNDAELIGFPYRVTIGPRGVESGMFEVQGRSDGSSEEVAVAELAQYLIGRVTADRET